MNASIQGRPTNFAMPAHPSLLQLLNPRQYTPVALLSLAVGLILAVVGILYLDLQRWVATAIVLVVLLPAAVYKFRDDRVRFGVLAMLMSVLLTAQGAHTIEHIAQWAQYHGLGWTMRQSNGLLSAANAEWVHFVWNWAVLLIVVALVLGGMRNAWAYLLLAITLAHTFEHTYLFVRHLDVLSELRELGVTSVTAQGLPGIVGRDGWLARNAVTRSLLICTATGLTTATRLDVHFYWNVLEMSALLLAGHVFLRRRAHRPANPSTPSG